MELQAPMRLVTTSVDGAVLAALARADAAFTVRDLRAVVGGRSASGIRLALERLVEQGIVRRIPVGPTATYALARDHIAAAAIIDIATSSTRLWQRVRALLGTWELATPYAAVFGSSARGTMAPDSDIDLAVVQPTNAEEQWIDRVHELERAVSAWTGNDARVLVLREEELSTDGSSQRVVGEILRDAIVLTGSNAYLRKLTGS